MKQWFAFILLTGCAWGQAWNGVLAPARAIDWSSAGAGAIPARTTKCQTLNPGATIAQINTAITNCTAGQTVFLSAGTFSLAGNITPKSNITLRGAGANQTFLIFSAGGAGPIYTVNADTNYSGDPRNQVGGSLSANWTAGYAPGTTTITLDAKNGLQVGSLLILDQQDDATDPGNVFVTQDTGSNGTHTQGGGSAAGRPGTSPCNTPATCRSQMQQVIVTSISGGACPCTVGITPGLYAQNWRSGQNPGAWWSSALPITGVGIEDLSIDVRGTAQAGQGGIIYFQNASYSWVKDVRSLNTVGAGCWKNHVRIYQSVHITVRDSYFYGSCGANDSYAVDPGYGSADNLIENNIGQQIASSWIREGDAGSVFAYNFAIDDFYTPSGGLWQQSDSFHHGPDSYGLWEGNQGIALNLDNIHNSGSMKTAFRNYWPANESGKSQNTQVVNVNAYTRYTNLVGNILGTSGKHTIYQVAASSATDAGNAANGRLSVYALGYSGNEGTRLTSPFTIDNDLIAISSLMRWGNCDPVHGFTSCQFVAGENGSGAPTYPGLSSPSSSLPASFYLSSTPSWFGSIPFPPMGPDVSSGNIPGTGGRVNKIPARVCYDSMGGPADGTGAPLTFNPVNCYTPVAPSNNPVPQTSVTGAALFTGALSTQPVQPVPQIPAGDFVAALPINWVNSGLTTGDGFCPTSGFDATKTMPGDYAATVAGLIAAKNDQVAANQNWLLIITAGTNIHGAANDANNSLLSWPVTAVVPKCLVIRSSTHNTDGRTVCSQVWPTVRDQNCVSDGAKFWKLTIDSTPITSNDGMFFPRGSNYIVVEDMEVAPLAGSSQSQPGVVYPVQVEILGDHIGLAYNWVHGWNPGDAGQPGTVCPTWNRSGIVNTANIPATFTGTVTWVSGDRFGTDFSDGTHSPGYPQATIVINGISYVISNHDPAASNNVLTVSSLTGTQTGVAYTMTNPATTYAHGCGDDSRGILANGTNYFLEYNYINKIHTWNFESHAISSGFSPGPYKIVHNFVECGAGCWFSGGGAIQARGGPASDYEIRGNTFMRDLNWRFLTAGGGNSPHPPFGCGPLDKVFKHDTCPFSWGIKNNIECKFCSRILFSGNIVSGDWADGQSGYLVLMTPRSDNSGYDPVTGLPSPSIDNVRFENNWFRDSPQVFQLSTRSLGPGNGTGMSQAERNLDWINNLITNVKDDNQFGTPGPDLFQWAASGQTYIATVSRTANVAHAVAIPVRIANYDTGSQNAGFYRNAFDVSKVSSVSDVVTLKLTDQWDPKVGGLVTVTGIPGWNGSFTITGVINGTSTTLCTLDPYGNVVPAAQAGDPQPCIRADGTFGISVVYTDSINHPGTTTLCATVGACNALGIQVLLDSLDFNITDISIGDGVYVHGCSDASLNSGATSFNPALPPTNPAGLDVYYASIGPNTSGISCLIENSSGLPINTTYQYNTDLAIGINSIGSNGIAAQHLNNRFYHNVFAMPVGSNAVLIDSDVGGQGTAVYAAWDANTFNFYDNVMQGRTSSQWSVVPSAAAANSFPATVTCSGATADPTCLGYSGYMNGAAFPNTPCAFDGANTLNCPMMAAPWSTNFDLTKIVPVATSSYQTQGVNLTTLQDAFTRTKYVCPTGANCGTTGPYPD